MNADNSSSMTASRNASTAISPNGASNADGIFEAARTRWLTVEEIMSLLSNAYESEEHESIHGIPSVNSILRPSNAPPRTPPASGTVFLYDRVAVRNYKADGHAWIRKRSNPTKIREDHVKLRYKGSYRVGGNYVHSADVDTFHRRVYRLLETDEEKTRRSRSASGQKALVLVHYLDTNEAAKLVATKHGVEESLESLGFGDSRSSSGSRSGSGKRIRESGGGDVSQYQKRTQTANSHAEVMNAPSRYHYHEDHCHIQQRQGGGYYQQQQAVAWSPYATMTNAGTEVIRSSGPGGRSTSSEAARLDRVNFEQLWGSVESDAALARGLDQLLEADAAVKVSSRRGDTSSAGPRQKK